ncbi:hypothetical protein ABEB33_10335 [Herbaspirillum huttiense]|uniref:hypothetical protein n=1 Tax=Herbaspirillum huttiense TaxID=863372 RepID=UPI00387844A3
MREIPLLMNGPMVRATLAGHKTNTRREIIRLGGFGKITQFGRSDTPGYDWHFRDSAMRWHDLSHAQLMKACPYGQVGDRLWVRETWRGVVEISHPDAPVKYGVARYMPDQQHWRRVEYAATQAHDGEPWRPNIHMPRWACRILLEITGVRVERLQDGEGEAAWGSRYLAEGIHKIDHGRGDHYFSAFRTEPHSKNWADPFDAWRELWSSTGGNWDTNPWVWVIEFRRIK